MYKNVENNMKTFGVKKALSYLDSDPNNNIPKLIKWVETIDTNGDMEGKIRFVRDVLSDPDNVWNHFIKSLWTDIDDEVRKKLFENFVINATMIGGEKQKESMEKYKCNIPWAILMDPTSACNLKCTGCWAADYGNKLSMDYDTLDTIIKQGKKLGTYMYIYSGGEPLIRKSDIIKLCEKHNDCVFLAFTNGTLIDDAFADEMLRVKNFLVALSIEGFEKETDFRRGEGTFGKVIIAMDILKMKKLPFGFSSCYTSKNTETIGSDEYFDEMIVRGAKFGWFFTYMPVGVDAAPELMVTPEQRKFMYHQIRNFRKTKPLFTIDFWNDGEYVDGCIAGGRAYLHINANGDIEPCAFIHYSDSNIHNNTLLDAYRSPLFMQYYKNQPFNENHLRPCPLLDNPHELEKMVILSGAKSTEILHPENVHQLCSKCEDASKKWGKTADDLWQESNAKIVGPKKEADII